MRTPYNYVKKDLIRESLVSFPDAEHRMEHVLSIKGMEFINDSKATNVNAVWFALDTVSKGIVWIMGGVDKGNDYSVIKELVREKVKTIICLGMDNKKIIKAFRKVVPEILESKSAKEAVAMAYRIGKKGDLILLSPACASFDLFDNYEDRGRKFKQAVKQL